MAALTRRAIVNAFAELASVKPVDKITVKDITEKCQLSRNTFYYHFQDVYEVLEELLNAEGERVHEIMKEHFHGNGTGEVCLQGYEYMLDHRDLFYNLYQSLGRQEVKRYLDQSGTVIFGHLVDELSRDIPAGASDKIMISNFLKNAVLGFLIDWLEGRLDKPMEDIMKRMDFLLGEVILDALKRSAEQPE